MAPCHFGASATGLSATDAGFVLPVIRVNLAELCRVPDQSPTKPQNQPQCGCVTACADRSVMLQNDGAQHGETCVDDHQTKPSTILCLASIGLQSLSALQ